MTKIAGNGSGTFSGDGGSATSAGLSAVEGIAIGNDGSIYLCDTYNNRVRKITADGIIHTIAGGNGAGFAGDNGPAAGALINVPTNIALDAIGNLYIRDSPATMPPPPAPPGTKVPLASRLTSRAK